MYILVNERLFVEEIRCLRCWSPGLSFVFYSVFLCQLHTHIHVPLKTYCSRLFVVVFRIVHILLNMTLFVGTQSYISPPRFMFVSVAVSEIYELKQNKKKKKN